jgi:hypothetical protein
MVNKQIHTHNTRNNNGYHKYVQDLELYDNKPSVAGCILYNILPNNVKQIENKNQFTRELKKLVKGAITQWKIFLNEKFQTLAAYVCECIIFFMM